MDTQPIIPPFQASDHNNQASYQISNIQPQNDLQQTYPNNQQNNHQQQLSDNLQKQEKCQPFVYSHAHNQINKYNHSQQLSSRLDQNQKTKRKVRPQSSISRQCWTQINQLRAMKAQWQTDKQLLIEEDLLNHKKQKQFKQRRKLRDGPVQIQKLHKNQDDRSSISSGKSHRIRGVNSRKKSGFSGFMVMPHQLKNKNGSQYQDSDRENTINDKASNCSSSKNQRYHNKFATIEYSINSNKYKQKNNNRVYQTSRSRSKNNSFVLSKKNTKYNHSKQVNRSQSGGSNFLNQSRARQHIQLLNKKVKLMQQKLKSIQTKQNILQEEQKKFHTQKIVIQQPLQYQKTEKRFKLDKQGELNQDSKFQNKQQVKTVELEQQKVSKFGKASQKQIITKNAQKQQVSKSEMRSRPPSQKSKKSITSQSNNGKRGLKFKKIKLDISSSIFNYNLTQFPEAAKEQTAQQKLQRQKQQILLLRGQMQKQIVDLKKTIRDLKLQKIKREVIIAELQDQKNQQSKPHNQQFLDKKEINISQVAQQRVQQIINKRFDTQSKNNSRVSSYNSEGYRHAGSIVRNSQNYSRQTFQIQTEDFKQHKKNQVKINYPQYHTPSSQGTPVNIYNRTQNIESKVSLNHVQANPQCKQSASDPNQISRISATLPTRKGIIIRQLQTRKMSKNSSNKIQEFNSVSDNHNSQSSFIPNSTKNSQVKKVEFIPIKQFKRGQPQTITAPQITIPNIQMPQPFPIPEHITKPIQSSWAPKQLLLAAKKAFEEFDIIIKSNQGSISSQILMRKYKNCVIFTIVNNSEKTIVWHYSGKFYIGGWVSESQIGGTQNNDCSKIQQNKCVKHGNGFQYLPGRYCYKGQFKNGKKAGKGTMITDEGDIYFGSWQRGQKSEYGTLYEKNTGMLYEGYWKNNKKDGKGTLKFSDKQFYIGDFLKNLKHGQGVQLFANGDMYEGQYDYGVFHGDGKYFWASGPSYNGGFVKGRRHGFGKWRASIKDGDYYEGQYKQDKKDGSGLYIWENGSQYQGQFKSDMKHGKGSVQYVDGRRIQGTWQYGKLAGIYQTKNQQIAAIPEPCTQQQQQNGSLTSSIRQHISNLKESPYRTTQVSPQVVEL